MTVSASQVKELRESTGSGIMDCKKALKEANGDLGKAVDYLRQKGLSLAAKKSGRAASEGLVSSYIHAGGRIGVLVEINCETDFVARTDDFTSLVRDIAMHIAASNPIYLSREDISVEIIAKERDIYKIQAKDLGKPDHVIEKIVDGKMEKYYQEVCLLEQNFVKDPDKKINDIVAEKIAKLGENILIHRFQRYQLGEKTKK